MGSRGGRLGVDVEPLSETRGGRRGASLGVADPSGCEDISLDGSLGDGAAALGVAARQHNNTKWKYCGKVDDHRATTSRERKNY